MEMLPGIRPNAVKRIASLIRYHANRGITKFNTDAKENYKLVFVIAMAAVLLLNQLSSPVEGRTEIVMVPQVSNDNPTLAIMVPEIRVKEPKTPETTLPNAVVQKKKAKPATKNEYAPAKVKDLPPTNVEDYIRRYSHIARVEMEKFKIPASISLAQGIIESRSGTSTLARINNNHFGIKCFSRNCPGGHCSNHSDDHHKDFFRIFGNPWESWRAHSHMISSGRYAKLKKHGKDYEKWAYGLKNLGYATDKAYATTLISIIKRYELYKYDK